MKYKTLTLKPNLWPGRLRYAMKYLNYVGSDHYNEVASFKKVVTIIHCHEYLQIYYKEMAAEMTHSELVCRVYWNL